MKSTRILHVDDEPDIRAITRLTLELDPDFQVDSVESGEEALRSIETSRPELILLDVMMPKMDGPSLMRELKSRPEMADIPVVFMTAIADQRVIEELVSLGALGIISKPFDPMSLAEELKSLLGEDLAQAWQGGLATERENGVREISRAMSPIGPGHAISETCAPEDRGPGWNAL